MVKIAFCDDDMEFIKNYNGFAEKINEIVPVNYDNYMSGTDLLENYDKHDTYDIVFLDIELGIGSINGIETAKKLKKIDDNVLLVFSTNHTEFVYESFEVEPYRFIVKPFDLEKFKSVIFAAYKKLQERSNSLYLISDKTSYHVLINDIFYIESNKRVLVFHFKDNSIKSYGKLDDYAQKLYINDFISVHKSYLINFNYVAVFESESIGLRNNVIIPISRNKRKYTKDEHAKFVMRKFGANDE
jgi:two-component system, LytTR family, response regulator LytT